MSDLPDNRVIRPRAFILGIVLAMVICALTPFNNLYRQATPLGGGYFPLAPFYILVWMTLLTALGRRLFPGRTFMTGLELIFTWMLMVLVAGIAYTGFARTFFINITAPLYFGAADQKWRTILSPLLPDSLFPTDRTAVEMLYNGIEGGRTMGWGELAAAVPWGAWLAPFLSWALFMVCAYFLMLCLINLINRQATVNERMNFPLLIVPRMMEQAVNQSRVGPFFKNRFLLTGMAIPVLLHGLNGLNFYFPWVPQINTLVLAGSYFPRQGIFAGFVKLKLYFYPAFIGFAYLASKQVSFSFWFFFFIGALFTGLLTVTGHSFPASDLGVTFGPTLSRPEETQMIGAFIVFFLFLMWLARFYFKEVAAHAFFLKTGHPSAPRVRWDRRVFWATVISFFLLVAWLVFHGMNFFGAVALLLFFVMFMMVATRVVCQGGVTYFTLTVAPLDALNTLVGLKIFSSLGLLLAGVTQKVLFVDLRESVMPSILHTHRVARRVRSQGVIAGAVFVAMVVCLGVSAIAMVLVCYRYGIRELGLDWATRTTVSVYNNLVPLIHDPPGQGDSIRWFALMGAMVMMVLVAGYHRFYWWPLHPIGYLMVYSSAMKILWLSFFIGWIFNALCMRYGGVTLYKRMRYFFVGLILGDFLMGGTFAVIGFFTRTGYQVLPG
ncbi:MAG: hypothetical protein GY737_31545 [Desulfobacteraceae bacterium]|nr:hypothetical protein [Desulfobacteraceae bacterium]